MEQLIIPYLTAALVVLLTFFSLLNRNRNKKKSALLLPPGTTGWPIIGENIEFFSHGRKNTPEKFIEDRVNKYSSQVFMTSLLGENVAFFCGAQGNKFVFSNEGSRLQSWWPKTVQRLFAFPAGSSFPEELNQVRILIRSFFRPEQLNRSTQQIDSLTKRHLQFDLDHKGKILGCDLAKKYSFMYSCRLYLSIEDQDLVAKLFDPFSRLFKGLTSSIHINFPGTSYNGAVKAKDYLKDEIINIINERMKKTTDSSEDLLSYMLLKSSDENRSCMNIAVILAAKIIPLFMANDSINSAIALTMKYLAELPDIYNKVLKEQREIAKTKLSGELLNLEDLQKMSYTWNVVSEVMRINPSYLGTFSTATCDISYAGFSIPKGSKVHWNVFSTHRNPKYFPEPERFDPSRFEGKGPAPYTYVPFGGGSRTCPGMAYGRCAILVFLHNLVTRCSWKTLIPDENTSFSLVPKLQYGLPVQFQPLD